MNADEIKGFLKGVEVRLQKAASANSGIHETEWRGKYTADVDKLKGIVEGLLARQEPVEEDKKSYKRK